MATVSTSADLDSFTRTAGETWTITSGATLTINSDTRYSKGAPASNTGSLGSITLNASTGGKVLIDGTAVRWLAYTGGSGNVPAAGTTITGSVSGASGELLNVTSALNATPTTAGSAMPASGFIKLKSVTSGPFNSSESLTGITATTSAADVTGWIEVCLDDAATITVSRTCSFEVNGDWFYLDTTTGSRGQIVQCPCPSGANTRYAGVWIETGVGTDTYEFWPAQATGTGTGWSTSHKGTDSRSRFVEMMDSGRIRIGSDGTNNLGDLPVSGCKIRVPNVLLMSAATASRASNSLPNGTLATRPDFTTTSAGRIDIDRAIGHWYFSLAQAYSVSLISTAFLDQISITECATSITLTDSHNGNYSNGDANALVLTSNFAGGTFTGCKFGRTGTIGNNDYGTNCSFCFNLTFTNCHFQNRTFRTSATGYPVYFTQCNNITLTNPTIVGGVCYFNTVFTPSVSNMVYADSFHTTSSATSAQVGAIAFANNSADCLLDGASFWPGIANVHPDSAYVYTLAAQRVKIRNVGSTSTPLDGGSSNTMLYFWNDGGNSADLKLQRCYTVNIATRFGNSANSTKGLLVENCSGDYADVINTNTAGLQCLDMTIRSLAGAAPVNNPTSIYGSHFYHLFTSATVGRIGIMFNEATPASDQYLTETFTGESGFTSTGTVNLFNQNDGLEYTWPHPLLGFTSFQNVSPTLAGTNTGNHTIEYQIDTGSGFGSWTAATGANLSAESISASGFNFKVRITCNTASTTNALNTLYFAMNTDATSQNQTYVLDSTVVSVILENVIVGSRYLIQRSSDNSTLFSGTAAAATVSQSFTHTGSDVPVKITVRKASSSTKYLPFSTQGTITTSGLSVYVSQVADSLIG